MNEKMAVTVKTTALDDPNHQAAIDDMTGYIERNGGKIDLPFTHLDNHDTYSTVTYTWTIPSNWGGRFYERFKSFGLHARVTPESMWHGIWD